MLEEPSKLFVGQAGLFKDGFEGTPLQVPVVIRERNTPAGLAGMFQDIVAA